MGVMEQAVVSVSPGESLVPDSEVIIRDEGRSFVPNVSLVVHVGVYHGKTDGRDAAKEEKLLPQFVVT